MKTFMNSILITGILYIVTVIVLSVYANYRYEATIHSYWELADKSSTLKDKSMYMDKFVTAIDNANLAGQHDAIIFKTNDNSFDYNFTAVKSLQTRLHEIQTLDINSFAYQSAIQQITEQEQGQASDMLKVIKGCWYKTHYIILWNWIGTLLFIFAIILIIIPIISKN